MLVRFRTTPATVFITACTCLAVASLTRTPHDARAEAVASVKNAPAVNGNDRLSDAVVPLAYTLDLFIDPSRDTFTGTVNVGVRVNEPTQTIRLHAEKLSVTGAFLTYPEKPATPLKVEAGTNGGLALHADGALSKGDATLTLTYNGPLDEVPTGLYRVKEGDRFYAYTQFEPLEAREAFPCFDEPRFKVPFSTSITTTADNVALSNMPEASRQPLEGARTRFSFATTPALPTYLVAFAVGAFDIVEAKGGAAGVPLRVVTVKGKGKLAQFALEKTPAHVKALVDYFGTPFPYAKIDLVAVPNFSSGAMENVGLITFREVLLLIDGKTASAKERFYNEAVTAHELAHMWFGNLVTMTWWDDLWLNEAFATWMENRTVETVSPDLEADLEALSETLGVMSLDAKAEARAVRQPIKDGGDVYNAFDGITYTKGAAIIAMLESWLTRDVFRTGIRGYLAAKTGGNATSKDLLDALDAASGKPVTRVATSFIDQPGVPLVTAEVTCNGTGNATLKVKQERFRVAGSRAAATNTTWSIPMCVRYLVSYPGGGANNLDCFVVSEPETTVTLSKPGCPTWLHPNAEELGYYRWALAGDGLAKLTTGDRKGLPLRERIALPHRLAALLDADKISARDYIAALDRLAPEQHRLAIEALESAYQRLHRVVEGDEAAHRHFAAKVRKAFIPHLARIGPSPRDGEPVANRLLRPMLVNVLADAGEDPGVRKEAFVVTEKYLNDPSSVAPEVAQMYLPVAAMWANEKVWNQLRAAIAKAGSPMLRAVLTGSLGRPRDTTLLQRALDLTLTDEIRSQDFWSVARGAMGHVEGRKVLWSWMTKNYDRVVAKIGEKSAPSLPYTGAAFCSEEDAAAVEAFFADAKHRPAGSERNLAITLESIRDCARGRARLLPQVKESFGVAVSH